MINIAIDGYSGSGKGTLAKGLAEHYNLKHLDTGAILRAMGLYLFENNLKNPSMENIENNIKNYNISIEFEGDKQITYLNDKDVSADIRREEIGQMASKVAANKSAMMKLIEISQQFAKNYNCVMDGRNITSEVLPNADAKIFLDASLETRATRRFLELKEKGLSPNIEDIKASLAERDYRDTHREFSPMIQTDDSIYIDNSNINGDETIKLVISRIDEKLKNK